MVKSTAVINPNLGLYYDRPNTAMSVLMLQDGLNFRIRDGALNNLSLGWNRFAPTVTLNGRVMLIANFFLRNANEELIFGTPTDLYEYNAVSETVLYLTPRYDTGTASASGTAVTGIGTSWTAGTPVNAKAGDEIHFGDAAYRTPTGTWFTIQSVNSNTSITLTTSAGVIGAGAYTIRRKFTGDQDDTWSFDTFLFASPSNEDEWWATNGVDPIIRWNGTDTQASYVSGLGFTAKTLAVYRNMMIFGNLVKGGQAKPTYIINSDVGLPQNAGSAGTGLSEEFRVHDGTDGVLSLKRLGENLVIYSENTVSLSQFVGNPDVFVFRDATTGIGPVGAKAIAVYADFHEFIGNDSQYRFDGSNSVKVNKHLWREVLRQQDPARIHFTYSHFDEENGDLIWSVPSTADPGVGDSASPPTRAYQEHYLEEVGERNPTPFSKRTFPFTATGYFERQSGITWDQLTNSWATYNFRWDDQFFQAAFPLNIGGTVDGKLYTFNTAQDADGAALPSFVKFGRRTFDGRMRGLIRRVYPFVSTFANAIDVTVHLADHAQGGSTINAEFSFDQTLPEGRHFVSVFRRGRFYEVEFGTDGPAMPWKLSGYDVDVSSGGMR